MRGLQERFQFANLIGAGPTRNTLRLKKLSLAQSPHGPTFTSNVNVPPRLTSSLPNIPNVQAARSTRRSISLRSIAKYLTPTEVEKLIKEARQGRYGHRHATFILLAFRHGLRASEICESSID